MPIRKIRQIKLAPAVSLPGSITGSKIGLVIVESTLSKSYVHWLPSLASEFKAGQQENWQPSPVSAMLHGKPCEEFQQSNIELGSPFFAQIKLNFYGFFALGLMVDPAIKFWEV